ncbi:MAG: DUF6786 family protein [Bacteroidota bacterium]
MNKLTISAILLFGLFSCNTGDSKKAESKENSEMKKEYKQGTYGYDSQFLASNLDLIELTNGKSKVAVVAEYQGRVMTSSCNGYEGNSYGWINYDLIKSGEVLEHMNGFGGEERFWLGPEGGQFSIFFKKGVSFDFENWFTPKEIDTEAFKLISKTEKSASFERDMSLENYTGTKFDLKVNRDVNLLSSEIIGKNLGVDVSGVEEVAYETVNKLTNTGENSWDKDSGMLSVWLLGMLNPSPEVTVVIPVKEGSVEEMGVEVNDNYFGKVSADRLKTENSTVYFKADGKSRGKIGISPKRAKPILGSYDAENKILTIVEVILPKEESKYVNSAWELQDDPFSGDAINSYNDGPLEDGSQMGPFYEIESSSPALALKSGESYTHTQRTYHFEGSEEKLDVLAKKLLGVSIEEIKKQF